MSSDQNRDADLVKRYITGEKEALAILVKRWHKLFCEKAYWMVKDKDAAKDIAQDSWSTIIHKIELLKAPKQFKYWAYSIVRNKSMDWLRQQSKMQRRSVSSELPLKYEPEDHSESEVLKQRLLNAIQLLTADQKAVLKLFYIEAYSLKQISNIVGVSVGTVKSRLFHAREKLKTILKHRTYES